MVFVGDSIFAVSGAELSGELIAPSIPNQFREAVSDNPDIDTVVGDAGGNDLLIPAIPFNSNSCKTPWYRFGRLSQKCTDSIDNIYVEGIDFLNEMAESGAQLFESAIETAFPELHSQIWADETSYLEEKSQVFQQKVAHLEGANELQLTELAHQLQTSAEEVYGGDMSLQFAGSGALGHALFSLESVQTQLEQLPPDQRLHSFCTLGFL